MVLLRLLLHSSFMHNVAYSVFFKQVSYSICSMYICKYICAHVGNRLLSQSGTRLELAKSRTFTSLRMETRSRCVWSCTGWEEHHFVSSRTSVTTTNTDHLCPGCTCHVSLPLKSLHTWRRYTTGDFRCLGLLTSIAMQLSCSCLTDIHCKILNCVVLFNLKAICKTYYCENAISLIWL